MKGWLLVLATLVLCGVRDASAAPQALRGIAVDETLDAPSILTAALPHGASSGASLLARLAIDLAAFRGAAAADSLARLDARLDAYRASGVSVILVLGAFPALEQDVDPWLQTVRVIIGRASGRARACEVGDASALSISDAVRYAYVLKRAATEIKAADSAEMVLQGPMPASALDFLAATYRAGVAPYSDGVVVSLAGAADSVLISPAVEAVGSLVQREDPSASIVIGTVTLRGGAAAASAQLTDSQLRTAGTPLGVIAYAADAALLQSALAAAAAITDLISGDIVTLDEAPSQITFLTASLDRALPVSHRLLYSPSASSTYLIYWSDTDNASVELRITTAAMTTPAVRDPLTGDKRPLTMRQLGGSRIGVTLPLSSRVLILDFSADDKSFTSEATARGERLPPVEEIIAKAQQAQAVMDDALTRYIAHVRVETHFRPVPADPAYNVVTENRLFMDRSGVEWEELSFSMNGATWTANRPGFPLLQPEKVLSLPLDLRLNQDYTYRLSGVEQVAGHAAFIVEFTPTMASQALYRGTVWIDRQTFTRLKVDAVETHLTGPIVSNEETEIFEPAGSVGNRPVWLLGSVTSRQVLLIAGRSVPLERDVHFSEFALNPSTFDEDRAAARAGDRIMYRDTDRGLRYFVKQGNVRVVSDTLTTSAKAMVMGTDIDPSFTRPLPIAGLDLLDFNFLHKNMQLALLFGGVLGTGNIQKAGLFGGSVNASLDFFGIALKAQDVVFNGAGEETGKRVLSLPASVGFNLGWQLAPSHKVTARYEFRYDAYFRDPDTAPDFVVPSSTATDSVGVGYEYRKAGYSLTTNASTSRRSSWRPWGTGDFDPSTRSYVQYQAQASRDFILATFHTIHVNAAYFGGERLDRFSSYRSGLFDDTKIHGLPSAVRLSELAMVRASYAFNLFDQYRVEASLDRVEGRGTAGGAWQTLTGVGLGLNLRGPRNTILRTDVGKSFLPALYRGSGSYRIQIMLLKPLK